MLNKLWGIMLLAGIVVAAFTGKIGDAGTAAIDSSKEAVTLCIAMLGVMCMDVTNDTKIVSCTMILHGLV